ncbi:MAG: hypothetical protein J6C99_02615 [Lachnospiraceae bacterium]|nr:hypothetical protein [Lachnospiraceae bacterium]
MRKIFRNNKIKICLILFFCVAVILASVLVPKYLLARTLFEQMDQVVVAPEEYYVEAGEMMARSASSNLSSVDRIKLIAGTWESEMQKCENTDGFLNEVEAVELAKEQMEYYYQAGVFPYSMQIKYDNMFSYETELYCYTDSSFHTYSAYLWKITFTKYDDSVECVTYMTESGTILLLWTDGEYSPEITMKQCYDNLDMKNVFGDNRFYQVTIGEYMPVTAVEIPYPMEDELTGEAIAKSFSTVKPLTEIVSGAVVRVKISGESIKFQALQYKTKDGAGIVFMPFGTGKNTTENK